MNNKKVIILIIIFLSIDLFAVNFKSLMENGPIVTINNDKKDQFHSVTVYAMANAPFEYVWEAITDINRYYTYMPRVKKSLIYEKTNYGKEVTAKFVIKVPLKNSKYVLTHYLDKQKKEITVKQIKGDLKGSTWNWKFEDHANKTLLIYTGRTINYSKLIEAFEDKQKTITMGINISSCLTTIKYIKERSEFLYKKK